MNLKALQALLKKYGTDDLCIAIEAVKPYIHDGPDDWDKLAAAVTPLLELKKLVGRWSDIQRILSRTQADTTTLDPALKAKLDRRMEELEMSVRLASCLTGIHDPRAKCDYIGEIVQKSEAHFLKTKQFGRKTLRELKELLNEQGLTLYMNVQGWTPPTK